MHVGQDVTYMAYIRFVSPVMSVSVRKASWSLRLVTFTTLTLDHPDNIKQTVNDFYVSSTN